MPQSIDMKCPRRVEGASIFNYPETDTWRPDGTCSYCGSISAERFFQAVEDGVEISPTDKSYKAYVKLPFFAKFYFQHLSDEDKTKFIKLANEHKFNLSVPGYFYTTPYFCQKVDRDNT